MSVFINQNVKIRYGGRKAPKMNFQKFNNLILNGIIKDKNHREYLNVDFLDPHWINEYIRRWNKLSQSPEDNFKCNEDDVMDYFSWYGGRNPKLDHDFEKYDNSWENREVHSCGLTPSGIPYIELETRGDWEQYMCSYIYYDGKNFRGYIPERGNCVNRFAKAAFGNNTGYDILPETAPDEDMYDISKYSQSEQAELKKSDFCFLMSELFPNEPDKLLPIAKNWDIFEENIEDLEIDWEKCREDFFARLEAI